MEEENERLLDEFVDEGARRVVSTGHIETLKTVENDAPSLQELRTLRKVPDALPKAAFLVAIIELCERFAYYGLSGPFQNYMQNGYPDTNGVPGALGLGQKTATALSSFFQFWCYLTPVLGAIVADQYFGRFRTIVYFSIVYIVGLLVLFFTSTPIAIGNGFAYVGLIISMIVIGLGAGGIKANVSPLIGEQYRQSHHRVTVTATGERVIVDPSVTIQRIYMVFYMSINIGSLGSIPTTLLERHIGFWSAYLLPLCMFLVGFTILITGRKNYVAAPPQGSVILDVVKILFIAIQNGGDLEVAKPSYESKISSSRRTWDDAFVDELRTTLDACKVFLFFPFYWMAMGQMVNNFVSQAGTMAQHGLPNDIMPAFNSIAVILSIPVAESVVFPALRKVGIKFKPITRITWGFLIIASAMAYAAFVQHLIYSSPPDSVHVLVQTPAYILIAFSEICASVTGLEYAFTKAPPSMKSFITSLYLLTTALGAVLAGLVSPIAVDPLLVWLYSGFSLTCLIAGGLFWSLFKHQNQDEDKFISEQNMAVEITADEVDGTSSSIPRRHRQS